MNFYVFLAIVAMLAVASYFWGKKPRTGFEAKYSPEIADDVCMRLFPDQDPVRLKALFQLYGFKFSERGTYTLQPPPGAVLSISKKIFAAGEVDHVIRVLNRYGSRRNQADREAVQLDIIKVSGGDAAKVSQLVEQAKADFRDVSAAAKSPAVLNDISIAFDSTSVQARKQLDSDLQQYVEWLLRYADLHTRDVGVKEPSSSNKETA